MFYFLLFLSPAISLSPSLVSLYGCHHLQLCSPAVSGQKRNPLSPTCSSPSTHAILDFHSSSGEHQLPNLDSLHNREIFFSSIFFVRTTDREMKMKIIHTHNSLLWFPLQILPSDDSLGFVVLFFRPVSCLSFDSFCKASATRMLFSDCDVLHFVNN